MLNHHAYYIEGSPADYAEYKAKLKPFWANKFEKFGIDEARELGALAQLKNYTQATFFVALSAITSEAQQALLKLFEEPQEGTVFVVLLPHGVLLPTLRSRMVAYPEEKQQPAPGRLGSSQRDPHQVAAFLGATGKGRSDFIAKLLKDDEDIKERVLDFVNALEAALYPHRGESAVREGLGDIAQVRGYLRDRSPSLKILLEHLALALPTL